jgi:hypothetical protein
MCQCCKSFYPSLTFKTNKLGRFCLVLRPHLTRGTVRVTYPFTLLTNIRLGRKRRARDKLSNFFLFRLSVTKKFFFRFDIILTLELYLILLIEEHVLDTNAGKQLP